MARFPTPVLGRPVQGVSDTRPIPTREPRISLVRRIGRPHELLSFAAIGGLSFLVDLAVYNALRLTVLDDRPVGAKVVSVTVATIVAWLGNRYLTFRERRTASRREVIREGLLFAAMNLIGLGIATGCLVISHYVLGFTSPLADNVAGNGIGLVLGTAFRFLAYKAVVFRPKEAQVA